MNVNNSYSVRNVAEERAYAREKLIFNVTEDLLVIMEDKEISKSELARRLGKSKSYVTQMLDGARNLTLGTLSDICFALNVDVKVKLPVDSKRCEWQNEYQDIEKIERRTDVHLKKFFVASEQYQKWFDVNGKVA